MDLGVGRDADVLNRCDRADRGVTDRGRGVAVDVGDANTGTGCGDTAGDTDGHHRDFAVGVGNDVDAAAGCGDRTGGDLGELRGVGVDHNHLGANGYDAAATREGDPDDVFGVVGLDRDRATGRERDAALDDSGDVAHNADDQDRGTNSNEPTLNPASDADERDSLVGDYVNVVAGGDHSTGLDCCGRATRRCRGHRVGDDVVAGCGSVDPGTGRRLGAADASGVRIVVDGGAVAAAREDPSVPVVGVVARGRCASLALGGSALGRERVLVDATPLGVARGHRIVAYRRVSLVAGGTRRVFCEVA